VKIGTGIDEPLVSGVDEQSVVIEKVSTKNVSFDVRYDERPAERTA